MTHPVVGVVGGSGGVGASTFAAALAAVGPALLCDLDPVGGGIDVLLELEDEPGARWSGVHVDGGRLDAGLLTAGLPRWGRVPVLALDTSAPGVASVLQVIDTASAATPVVLDLGRVPAPARTVAVQRCCLVVVLARADIAALAAAHAVVAGLDAPLGAVVRPGPVPADRAAHVIGADLLARLPDLPVTLRRGRLPRRLLRVAAAVLAGVPAQEQRAA